MYLGYNTNGFAHHRLDDTLTILADLGYQGVALTLDYHTINPFEPDWQKTTERVGRQLERLGLRCVIETGARFLLDPWRKHQPTLLSGGDAYQRRGEFLTRAIEIAAILRADAVSFWSGATADVMTPGEIVANLNWKCCCLCDHAATKQVRLAFEPEPGMAIDTMAGFAQLYQHVGSHPNFGLTLDVGHLHCQGELPIAEHIHRWRDVLWNVHIEDMRRGVHEHLMFGEGEMDFPPILQALREIDYQGGVFVELSRHSHDAVNTARRARAFLREAMASGGRQPPEERARSSGG